MGESKSFRASDGYVWRYTDYHPAGSSRGRVVFLHGIRSHSGWYERSCERIAAGGWQVCFLNRRGAGPNRDGRGDTPGFRRLLDDVAEFVGHEPRPTVLAGVSWGGKLAAAFPYRHPGRIDGLMLLCPGLVARIRPSFSRRVTIALTRLMSPTKRYPIPLNEPELFTSSAHWQRFIDADEDGLREATARFLFASTQLDIYLRRAAPAVTVPSLLLLAENDRVIDNAATWRLTQRFRGGRTLVRYPDSDHTLEFENPDHPFVGDMIRWLDRLR
jgi:alpha-beta hydrolase superfamily lysophospholipase